MAERDFDEWLSKFRPSISSYNYYIDFEKSGKKCGRNQGRIKYLEFVDWL